MLIGSTKVNRLICAAVRNPISFLNQVLQEAMNPSKIFLRRGGTQYRLHDKVMQIRNNYDKEVFNAEGSIKIFVGLMPSVEMISKIEIASLT